VLAALLVLGGYGAFLGFLQSAAYEEANQWVALGAGVVGGGSALYLLLEFVAVLRGRAVLGVCVVCFLGGAFAVTRGVPASLTLLHGHQATVQFTVTGSDWGSKSCSKTVVASNPEFEEFRSCVNRLKRWPELGDVIEVSGMRSGWGIVRERVVLR
jgi:hypothetical protein